MSYDFEKLKNKWDLGYITINTLKKWVELNKKKNSVGITEQEFKVITGEEYN